MAPISILSALNERENALKLLGQHLTQNLNHFWMLLSLWIINILINVVISGQLKVSNHLAISCEMLSPGLYFWLLDNS